MITRTTSLPPSAGEPRSSLLAPRSPLPPPPPPPSGARRITTRLLRQRILTAIAAGHTPGEAAAAIGIGVRSVYRALEDPEIRAALDQLHAQRMQALLDASMELAPDALLTLKVMMDSPIVAPTAKIAAARVALAAMAAIVPLADTERRVAALEERFTAADDSSHFTT